jgi:hypothetical protein
MGGASGSQGELILLSNGKSKFPPCSGNLEIFGLLEYALFVNWNERYVVSSKGFGMLPGSEAIQAAPGGCFPGAMAPPWGMMGTGTSSPAPWAGWNGATSTTPRTAWWRPGGAPSGWLPSGMTPKGTGSCGKWGASARWPWTTATKCGVGGAEGLPVGRRDGGGAGRKRGLRRGGGPSGQRHRAGAGREPGRGHALSPVWRHSVGDRGLAHRPPLHRPAVGGVPRAV